MSAYLAYSYSFCLTEKEQTEIDKKVKKNQEEFCRGFRTGSQISLAVYSAYLLTATTAQAKDMCPDPGKIAPPADSGAVQPMPNNAPGFKPLSEGTRGTFIGRASAVCAATLQSGDFLLGLSCAALLVVGGIIVNRKPPHQP